MLAAPMTTAAALRVEDIAAHPDFVPLAAVDGIVVDLRYAGRDNFTGRVLYRGIDCAWLRREAADGLRAAVAQLARARPGWRLAVLDALRPQRVQQAIWDEFAGGGLEQYFAHPERGSIHSWGLAVDVTLVDAAGREVDMGSAFDAMTPLSHPELEADHLRSGTMRPAHIEARHALRAAMHAGGFAGIDNEWWHFDHGDRAVTRALLPRVL
jgi:D-alanyl-D-alanine dipeptidase